MPIRLIVAGDHAVACQGFRSLCDVSRAVRSTLAVDRLFIRVAEETGKTGPCRAPGRTAARATRALS